MKNIVFLFSIKEGLITSIDTVISSIFCSNLPAEITTVPIFVLIRSVLLSSDIALRGSRTEFPDTLGNVTWGQDPPLGAAVQEPSSSAAARGPVWPFACDSRRSDPKVEFPDTLENVTWGQETRRNNVSEHIGKLDFGVRTARIRPQSQIAPACGA